MHLLARLRPPRKTLVDCLAANTLLLLASFCTSAPAAEQPSFIIVFCDDLGYRDVGCFGSPEIQTPNIDRMAAEGARFTDFYSAYCVCSASRAGLLTGCYQPRISMRGVLGPHTRTALHPDEITIADMLASQGYTSACVGKWHVGDTPETLPTRQGFDMYLGLPYSNDMARQQGWGNNPPELDRIWAGKRWDIYNNELYRDLEIVESPVNQVTLTDRYTEAATGFIRDNSDGPFFLYLAHTMPHVPLFVSDDRYSADPQDAYRLTIEHIDWSVGQLLATLDELDIAENTFIVFTSDNGPWLSKQHHGGSALPLRAGKGTTYEGGMRVPCVMRWPERIEAGQECRQVAATIDLLPTFASIIGAEVPDERPIDGLDISELLDNPAAESPHDAVGYFYYRNNRPEAVRVGRWKLHLKEMPELYDLRADISESENLALMHPEVAEELQAIALMYDEELQRNARPAWNANAREAAE